MRIYFYEGSVLLWEGLSFVNTCELLHFSKGLRFQNEYLLLEKNILRKFVV